MGAPEGARKQTFWTNESVRSFAGDDDPIDAITARARAVVFEAVQAGWRGPPFDPVALARSLGLDVVARDDLTDARVVSDVEGHLRIEFNPTRPRGRLRYSIAHEIAHTFFPDVGDEVRHRTATGAVDDETSNDDWQLELLCNLAAGELLVPSLVLPTNELDDTVVDINRLMVMRGRFDVSTEAILRRAAQSTRHPVTMFAAARLDRTPAEGKPMFRLDYTVGSRSWDAKLPRGGTFRSKVLADCTAVGYTSIGVEQWGEGTPEVMVEAVGIPPYPGDRLPRVAGLLVRNAPRTDAPSIMYVNGDASEPRGAGPRLIAHVVNDAARAWGGAGFAVQLRRKQPQAAEAYRAWTIARRDNFRLGQVHVVDLTEGISVASMVAQEGYGDRPALRVRYHALAECLERVREAALARGASVHMPRIGMGQGGAAWPLIAEEVDRALTAHGVQVIVYTRPGEHEELVFAGGRQQR